MVDTSCASELGVRVGAAKPDCRNLRCVQIGMKWTVRQNGAKAVFDGRLPPAAPQHFYHRLASAISTAMQAGHRPCFGAQRHGLMLQTNPSLRLCVSPGTSLNRDGAYPSRASVLNPVGSRQPEETQKSMSWRAAVNGLSRFHDSTHFAGNHTVQRCINGLTTQWLTFGRHRQQNLFSTRGGDVFNRHRRRE